MFFSEFFLAEFGLTPPFPKYKRVYERKEGFLSGWECIFLNVSASASSQLGLVRRYGSRWSPGARRLQIWTEPHSSQTTPHSIIDSLPLPQKSSRSGAYFLLNNPVKQTNQNCTTRKKASQRPSAVGCRGKLGELRPPSQGCPDTPSSI